MPSPEHGPMGGFGHPDGDGILFLLLHSAIWLVGILLLAWILWRWLGPRLRNRAMPLFSRPAVESAPIERLRVRFAAGEIDAVTFEQMQERLRASYQPGGQGFPSGGSGRPPEPQMDQGAS